MNRLCTFLAVVLTTGLALAAAPAARAATSRGINDQGNFFSPDAESRATAVINEIFDKHHGKEVLIETFNEVPAGQDIQRFAEQRATSSKVNGLYVAVVRKGGQVQVLAEKNMRSLFNDQLRNDLDKTFTTDLHKGPQNFDTALVNAVQLVNEKITAADKPAAGKTASTAGAGGGAAAGGAATGSGSSGAGSPGAYPPAGPTRRSAPTGCGLLSGGLMTWICLIAGVWLVFGLIRGVMRNRAASRYGPGGYGPGPGGGGYGGGPVGPGYGGGYGQGGYGGGYGPGYGGGGGMMGGGLGTSLLGGLFGAAAGNWMYDRFARGGGSAYGQTPPADAGGAAGGAMGGATDPGAGDPGWAQAGTDFSGGGGSTYSDPGGGDFGGGGGADFGGGGGFADSGGGDFGGGGSDFGGGGGDFGGGSE